MEEVQSGRSGREPEKKSQYRKKVGDEIAPGAEQEDGPMGASFREVDPV